MILTGTETLMIAESFSSLAKDIFSEYVKIAAHTAHSENYVYGTIEKFAFEIYDVHKLENALEKRGITVCRATIAPSREAEPPDSRSRSRGGKRPNHE